MRGRAMSAMSKAASGRLTCSQQQHLSYLDPTSVAYSGAMTQGALEGRPAKKRRTAFSSANGQKETRRELVCGQTRPRRRLASNTLVVATAEQPLCPSSTVLMVTCGAMSDAVERAETEDAGVPMCKGGDGGGRGVGLQWGHQWDSGHFFLVSRSSHISLNHERTEIKESWWSFLQSNGSHSLTPSYA